MLMRVDVLVLSMFKTRRFSIISISFLACLLLAVPAQARPSIESAHQAGTVNQVSPITGARATSSCSGFYLKKQQQTIFVRSISAVGTSCSTARRVLRSLVTGWDLDYRMGPYRSYGPALSVAGYRCRKQKIMTQTAQIRCTSSRSTIRGVAGA